MPHVLNVIPSTRGERELCETRGVEKSWRSEQTNSQVNFPPRSSARFRRPYPDSRRTPVPHSAQTDQLQMTLRGKNKGKGV